MDDLTSLVGEFARGGISRRQFLERGLLLGLGASALAPLVAACGGSSGGATAASGSPAAMDTTKPDRLYLFNWQNEIAPANKKKFQQATGIEVVESYFDDNEQLLAKLRAGASGYDLIVPTSYMVSVMVKSGLLQPLDLTLLPHLSNLSSSFSDPGYDSPAKQGGKKYSVPWLWGDSGIAMRLDKIASGAIVDMKTPSWALLWDDHFKGGIDMLNDERETIGAALKLLGHSFNSTSQAELDAATQKLIAQKPLVRAYDSLNMKRAIVSGMPLVHTWNGDAYLAQDELGADTVAYALPSEGFSVWVDNLCIPVGAKSPYGAHLFMDFMCLPENAADLVNYVQYLSPNEAAVPLIDPKIAARTPDAETMKRAEFLSDVGTSVRAWSDAWEKVKSS